MGPVFPDDRRYATGHLWVRTVGARRARIGLDALAAELVGPVAGLDELRRDVQLRPTDVACSARTRFGPVPLHLPVRGRVVCENVRLRSEPALAATDPYHDGWLLEVRTSRRHSAEGDPELLDAAGIEERARLDLRRFRRQVGMALLLEEPDSVHDLGPVLADGGERLTDLCDMLGAPQYNKLVVDVLT